MFGGGDDQFQESIHGGNPNCSFPFDPYQQLEFLSNKSGEKQQQEVVLSNLVTKASSSSSATWSSDEVLALVTLRSAVPISFPDFSWDDVSRKLGEMGFKRTAEECRKKFEEEGNNDNSTSRIYTCSQIEELVYPDSNQNAADRRRVRKEEKLEMVKGFVEGIVDRMMAKQEEMCKNLIEGIVRRDEEKMAREEAWKKEDRDRVTTEMELRVKEHEIAAQRQAAMVELLKNFNTSDHCTLIAENPNPNPNIIPNPPNQNSTTSDHTSNATNCEGSRSTRTGKRWPREEIVALIKLRCEMNNNGGEIKGRVWERISEGMGEMGYRRSGKRCKEKWENINKYFRKTKDRKKKRSGESRTCPYFQELSCLYSDGTLHLTPLNK